MKKLEEGENMARPLLGNPGREGRGQTTGKAAPSSLQCLAQWPTI